MSPVVQLLQGTLPRLYAIVDPAREIETLRWLKRSGLAHQSLFEGQKAIDLAEESPYVVHLASATRVSEFVTAFFGQGCVTFFTSERSFYDVRRHLRRFLLVKDEDGRQLFFRYYDPRIATVFLPTCDPDQVKRMFADVVDAFWAEDGPEVCVEMRADGGGERPVTTIRHDFQRAESSDTSPHDIGHSSMTSQNGTPHDGASQNGASQNGTPQDAVP